MQTRSRISLIVYCVSWQLPCNYFYWHQDWWLFVPQTYFSFTLLPYRSLDLKDYESWTQGSEAKTQFTYKIQQYCWKERSLAVTHQRVLLGAVLAEVPPNLFVPYYSFPSGVWEHGELTARHTKPKGFFFTPGLQQPRSALTYPGALGLFEEISADACDRSQSPTWKTDFQNVKVGAGSFLLKLWTINDITSCYVVTTASNVWWSNLNVCFLNG